MRHDSTAATARKTEMEELEATTARKAYSYLRFSTPEQSQGDSTRRQTSLAKEYADRHGLELDEKLTFHDLGTSAFRGKNREKGQLGAFLDAVEAGLVEQGSYLIVESLDRISRKRPRKAAHILEEICEAGIKVVTLKPERVLTEEALDDPDGMAFIMVVLDFVRAHAESERKSGLLKAAWHGKRLKIKEKKLTSCVPGWLKLNKETGEIEVIPERAEVVKRIYEMALKGKGQTTIAATLQADGVECWGSGKHKAIHWHRPYISKLLKTKNVLGTFEPRLLTDGKHSKDPIAEIPNYYPAVIDRETYDAVQSLRGVGFETSSKAPLRGKAANTGVLRNLFGGLAKCPLCGGTMTTANKGGNRFYLVCTAARAQAGCHYKVVKYAQVEEAFLRDSKWLQASAPSGDVGLHDQIDDLEKQIENITDFIHEGLEELRSGGHSKSIHQRVTAMERELDELKEKHSELLDRYQVTQNALVEHTHKKLETALKADPIDKLEVNAILRQLLNGIIIDYRTGFAELQWKTGATSSFIFDALKVFKPQS